ncbi:unnamed protein product [Pieris macdunnoughi]|uniref:Uncharacterized protein n=1 Tax=Pieris macdunnoughi TaxID=345717 RepID=A0A821MMK8_9NEOP|nr:unnamed protein product [Pieris macdunnoughi]
MDVEAKIKEDMKALGCTSEQKISLALYLYVTLVDDRLMYDTEYCYNTDIDTLYIVARPNKLHKVNIYVPIPSSFDLSFDYIEERRTFINGELKKHKESILNDALNGGFVDDDDCEIVG